MMLRSDPDHRCCYSLLFVTEALLSLKMCVGYIIRDQFSPAWIAPRRGMMVGTPMVKLRVLDVLTKQVELDKDWMIS